MQGRPLASLYLGRAVQSIYHTAELDEKPIACRLDPLAVIRSDRRVNQLGPDRLERLESATLVHPSQS
jgi:hypothetical protein